MPRYLLSTQSLLDVAKYTGLPAQTWLDTADSRGIARSDIFISAVAGMEISRHLDDEIAEVKSGRKTGSAQYLYHLRRKAEQLTDRFEQDEQIIAMDRAIADQWGELLDTKVTGSWPGGVTEPVLSGAKIELATALAGRNNRPLVYVDAVLYFTPAIVGLTIENP